MGYTTKDVVIYVVKKLGSIHGVKKLMKLVFLTQYEVEREEGGINVTKYNYRGEPITRTEFFIWNFGPMSNDVYDAIEDENFTLEKGDYPYVIRWKGGPSYLPESVVKRIDEIIERYGDKKGWELEREVLRQLDLDIPEKKNEYMGVYVDDYLRIENIELRKKDLGEEDEDGQNVK